jgi:hypothetical protein
LGKSETEDAVDTLEIRAVARSDASKLGECVVVAELHDIVCLVALERRVVGVLQEELSVLDVPESLGLARIEPAMVNTTTSLCEHLYPASLTNAAHTVLQCNKNSMYCIHVAKEWWRNLRSFSERYERENAKQDDG